MKKRNQALHPPLFPSRYRTYQFRLGLLTFLLTLDSVPRMLWLVLVLNCPHEFSAGGRRSFDPPALPAPSLSSSKNALLTPPLPRLKSLVKSATSGSLRTPKNTRSK